MFNVDADSVIKMYHDNIAEGKDSAGLENLMSWRLRDPQRGRLLVDHERQWKKTHPPTMSFKNSRTLEIISDDFMEAIDNIFVKRLSGNTVVHFGTNSPEWRKAMKNYADDVVKLLKRYRKMFMESCKLDPSQEDFDFGTLTPEQLAVWNLPEIMKLIYFDIPGELYPPPLPTSTMLGCIPHMFIDFTDPILEVCHPSLTYVPYLSIESRGTPFLSPVPLD